MHQLYLDLHYTSEIPGAYKKSADELSSDSGVNLGNFAFRHALRFIVRDLFEYTPVRWADFNRAADQKPVDKVVVSCANWLGQSEHDERSNLVRAKTIERVDGPVISFGLGVQAQIKEDNSLPQLGPNTLRLAHALSERCVQLSVRDQLTQDVLEADGIQNTVVTGCPSNFINATPNLGALISEKATNQLDSASSWKEVRSCISEASGGHGHSGAVMKFNATLMAKTPAFYLVQSQALLPFLMGARTEIPQSYRSNNPFMGKPGKLTQTLKAKTLHFSGLEPWMDFARTCDISFGMRIHGTMVPLQAGVPSILIAHDTRTVGLAERMGIPWISPEEFIKVAQDSPKPLFDRILTSMQKYDSHRKSLAQTMVEYLNANGLVPHQDIDSLSKS
ncbi:polysaccharide pyruvyl transferase family protein [Donghicola sp.]|jgi:hypothetical protein|uniref:polysaccharide pyruvyl transferase family protein n=1 Tax=Donghicola sp. TaxID=1929294 RepID=UPI0025DEFCB6|nr:polysaccharide pyruvyl transferase family protein [Donghicola sp.]MCT4579588.1 polysaccharide pyruvyl transferase family protein [Donghicola sp.]